MLFRTILTAIVFYLVYYWLNRLLQPRRRDARDGARRREEPAKDRYPGAIDAEFEELDKK
jgi:hypothetical protein